MTGFVEIALLLSAPLLLAATGELLLERAGSIQIGLEGTMLIGAYVAFAAGRAGLSPAASPGRRGVRGAPRRTSLRTVRRRASRRPHPRRYRLEPPRPRRHRVRLQARRRRDGVGPRGADPAAGSPRHSRRRRGELPRPGRPPPLARTDARRAEAHGGRRESGGAPLARPLRRGRPQRRRRRVRRPRRARRSDAHPHGLTDLRRRGHRRTRLPGPRSRRLRALETARPPSGRAPSRRRHRPSVPASGRRLRASLRLLHRPPRPRGARGARPRFHAGAARRRRSGAPRRERAEAPPLRRPRRLLRRGLRPLARAALSGPRRDPARPPGPARERPGRRLRKRLAEPRAGAARLPGRGRGPRRRVPSARSARRPGRSACRSTSGAAAPSRFRWAPARSSTSPSRRSTFSTTSRATESSPRPSSGVAKALRPGGHFLFDLNTPETIEAFPDHHRVTALEGGGLSAERGSYDSATGVGTVTRDWFLPEAGRIRPLSADPRALPGDRVAEAGRGASAARGGPVRPALHRCLRLALVPAGGDPLARPRPQAPRRRARSPLPLGLFRNLRRRFGRRRLTRAGPAGACVRRAAG